MRIELNKDWEFQKLPDENINEYSGGNRGSWKEDFTIVNLPHTWYQDGNIYKGTVIYRKKVLLEYNDSKRIFLNFPAAERWCKVFVNGSYAGEHKGGYSSFTFDITKYCIFHGENEFLVFVDNRSFDEISPLAGDFTVFGGLYRGVNLIITEKCCFDRTYYGTDGLTARPYLTDDGQGNVNIEARFLGMERKENVSVCYQIFTPEGHEAAAWSGTPDGEVNLSVPAPVLWDGKENPFLYRLHAELCTQGNVTDEADISFGFRRIALNAEKGFFLNGRRVKICGVAKHQDYGSVFNATEDEHRKQDMRDILEIGANAVRLSHYQHPQQMYQLCDEKGLIVWAEIPMLRLTEEPKVFENACDQMKELIFQNLHHPSICFWGIQNETAMFGESEYMYSKMQELDQLVKSLDPSRISACANLNVVPNDSPMNQITDAVGYNIYYGWYYGEMEDNLEFVENFHRDNPDIPLGITEYGVDCNIGFHSEDPKVKDYTEDYQAMYHETVYPIFRSKDYLWGTFIWNFYDFSSEIRNEGGVKYRNSKGLITMDRKIKKDAFYYYKAQWSKEPFVAIAQKRFVNRAGETVTLKVYSNQREVTLSAAGNQYTEYSENGVFFFREIPLGKGEHRVRAVSGPCADEAVFCGVDAPDASYTFVDPNPGLNVKNWFTDMVEEEKLFPGGRLSIRESCDTLLEYKEAMDIIEEFSERVASQMRERRGSLPLDQVLFYMKGEMTDARSRELNARLTAIVK